MTALSAIVSCPEFSGIAVTELNPDHGEEDLSTLKRFSEKFSKAMAGKTLT